MTLSLYKYLLIWYTRMIDCNEIKIEDEHYSLRHLDNVPF